MLGAGIRRRAKARGTLIGSTPALPAFNVNSPCLRSNSLPIWHLIPCAKRSPRSTHRRYRATRSLDAVAWSEALQITTAHPKSTPIEEERGHSLELDEMRAAGEDAAAEPLITRESSEFGQEEPARAEYEEEDGGFGWFVWILTLSAGVSGLLFGYDTGVISSTLVSIGTDLTYPSTLTTLHKSLITSSTSFFALVASPASGVLADRFGRKPLILAASLLFTLGAIWQALSPTVTNMILGRSIVGLAVGSASFASPLYISEVAPRNVRGKLITVNSLFITGGQVVAYLVGWAFAEVGGGWRWMVGLGAMPALVQGALLLGMPETPRWLVQRGQKEKARGVLKNIYGEQRGAAVEGILESVEAEIREERRVRMADNSSATAELKGARMRETFRELVHVGGNKRALVISCLLQGAQQLCGFNSLMYFSATIFAMIGFTNPIATSLTIACTNFIFTLITFNFIDGIGRRRILLFSIPFMVLGLALCATAFRFITLPKNEGALSSAVLALLRRGTETPTSGFWPTIIVLSMILYVASYALGLGCVPWQQSELFPLSVRGLGSGIATGTNWLCNTIVGFTFLPMMQLLTPTGTFAVYALVCVGAWIAVFITYPETAGLGLEGVRGLLEHGWGVEESMRGFKERRRMAKG